MKKLLPLVIGLILSTGTLSLQLLQMVPEAAEAASVPVQDPAAFHGGSTTVKRPKTLRKAPKTMVVAPVAAPVKLAQAIAPVIDPLAAIEQPDIRQHHRDITRRLLSQLPVECQKKLENFYVVYDDPNHRGLAGRGTIILNGSLNDRAFIGQLLHEGLGHFWDLTCTNGTAQSGKSSFTDGGSPVYNDDASASFYAISWTSESARKPAAKQTDFASGYAFSGDPFEDLAEAVTYYILQPEAFQARAERNIAMAQKYAWLKENFPLQQRMSTGSKWSGSVAWDASKVPYTWLGE